MNSSEAFSPRKPNSNLPDSPMPKRNKRKNKDEFSEEEKEIYRSINKRMTHYLYKFDAKNENHRVWLEKQKDRYNVTITIGEKPIESQLLDRELGFFEGMIAWFGSPDSKENLSKIQLSWVRFYSKFKTHYGVSMPNLTHAKLKKVSEKRGMSLNATVFDLIHQAFTELDNPSLEKVMQARFDKLERLLESQSNFVEKSEAKEVGSIKGSSQESTEDKNDDLTVKMDDCLVEDIDSKVALEDNVSEEQPNEEKSVAAMMSELTDNVLKLAYSANGLRNVDKGVVRNLEKSANRLKEKLKDEFGKV